MSRRDLKIDIDATARNAIRLRERDLHAAFLSPIDYARESSDYCIVPDVGVSSQVRGGSVALHFRAGIRDITSMAVDPSSLSEIVLATIILSEEFDIKPKIVPVPGSLEGMLKKADSALLIGDAAVREAETHHDVLDVVEEWNVLTGVPYVHGFWCARENDLSQEEILLLQTVGAQAPSLLGEIVETDARGHQLGGISPAALNEYLESFAYELTPDDMEGLREFLKYAYYHGVIPDVAEVSFFTSTHSDGAAADDLSVN